MFIYALGKESVEPAYLLCLFFYPNANLLYSLVRRTLKRKAFFGDDNGHLHNLLYRRLSSIQWVQRYANTLTGLLTALVFAGAPMLLAKFNVPVNWWVCYAILWVIYIVACALLADNKTRELMFSHKIG
jgi:hypothetical protein